MDIETEPRAEMSTGENTANLGSLSRTGGAWIPLVEQVLEVEVVGKTSGKLKARARAKAKDRSASKPNTEISPTFAVRKSQRARQPPAKFRCLMPRPLAQQSSPPVAPTFVYSPSSSALPPLPFPHARSPPSPLPVTNSGVTAGGLLLSSSLGRDDQSVLQSSLYLPFPAHHGISKDNKASSGSSRTLGANRRTTVRKIKVAASVQKHVATTPVLPSPHVYPTNSVEAASSCGSGARSEERPGSVLRTGSLRDSEANTFINSAALNSLTPLIHRVCGSIDQVRPSREGAGIAAHAGGRHAGKPPLPPNRWYRDLLRRTRRVTLPAILKRSFAHVPPPPVFDSYPVVPSRASLNNRKLGFPKAAVSAAYWGRLQLAGPKSSLTWLFPHSQNGNHRTVEENDGNSVGMGLPGQTRIQQKRRVRHLKNAFGKKFQNLMQGATFVKDPDSQRSDSSPVKQIVLSDQQREKLVKDMIEACRNDPKFRAKYLDAVKQLSYFGVLQTASYQLVAQGSGRAAQEVVDAWEDQLRSQEEASSASLSFYRAVDKVHAEGVETMKKLPSLKEAGSCSVTKRSDGAWVVTLPDEKKRRLNT